MYLANKLSLSLPLNSPSPLPSHLLFQDRLRGFPGLLTDTSEHIRFFLLFSLYFFHFLVVSSMHRAVD